MVTEADIRLADGRTLHVYDTPADGIASGPGAPGSAVSSGVTALTHVRVIDGTGRPP